MIDTVTMLIPRPPDWSFPSSVGGVREFTDKKTGAVCLSGFLKTMNVKDWAGEVQITGSLPRYFHGSNSITMTRAGIRDGIQSLSDSLSLPIGEARVYRLDVGANVLLRHPVIDYMGFLGPWKQSHRKAYPNGNLSYQAGQSTLTFYDKVLDLTRNGNEVPDHWAGKNILRAELQMKKAVKGQLGQAVYAKNLWEEEFYCKAIQKWESAYLSVEKLKQMEDMPMGSVKDARGFIQLMGVQAVGYENLLFRIKIARELRKITKDQAKELRRALKQMASYPKGEARGLIEELDKKVRTVSACYR